VRGTRGKGGGAEVGCFADDAEEGTNRGMHIVDARDSGADCSEWQRMKRGGPDFDTAIASAGS
jgi:hypothetical protein